MGWYQTCIELINLNLKFSTQPLVLNNQKGNLRPCQSDFGKKDGFSFQFLQFDSFCCSTTCSFCCSLSCDRLFCKMATVTEFERK